MSNTHNNPNTPILNFFADSTKWPNALKDVEATIEKLEKDLSAYRAAKRALVALTKTRDHTTPPKSSSLQQRLVAIAGDNGATLDEFVQHLKLPVTTVKMYLRDPRYGRAVLDRVLGKDFAYTWRAKKPKVPLTTPEP